MPWEPTTWTYFSSMSLSASPSWSLSKLSTSTKKRTCFMLGSVSRSCARTTQRWTLQSRIRSTWCAYCTCYTIKTCSQASSPSTAWAKPRSSRWKWRLVTSAGERKRSHTRSSLWPSKKPWTTSELWPSTSFKRFLEARVTKFLRKRKDALKAAARPIRRHSPLKATRVNIKLWVIVRTIAQLLAKKPNQMMKKRKAPFLRRSKHQLQPK